MQAVWPCLYREHQLSPGLRELAKKSTLEQVTFWTALAEELTPEEATAMLPKYITSDFLGRYFDSTELGSDTSYEEALERFSPDSAKDGNGKLHLNGMIYVLGTHYGLVQLEAATAVQKNENWTSEGSGLVGFTREDHELEYDAIERLWELVRTDDYITKASFDYILRRLRLGWMIAWASIDFRPESLGQVLHYDYDETYISGSMSQQTEGMKHWGWHGNTYKVTDKQIPVGDAKSDFASVQEFMLGDPSDRRGSVHWVHLHQAGNALYLIIGLMYGLGIHCLSVLCRLTTAQPQYLHSREWKFLTFPAVHVEQRSRASVLEHHRWKNKHNDGPPPQIYIAAITRNIAFSWHEVPEGQTATEDRNYHTCITAASNHAFLGRWSTKAEDNTFTRKVWNFFCWESPEIDDQASEPETESTPLITDDEMRKESMYGARRMSSGVDLEASLNMHSVRSDSKDGRPGRLNLSFSTSTQEKSRPMASIVKTPPDRARNLGVDSAESTDQDESGTSFEQTFEDILSQLGKEYSVLRMGSHRQLVYRILLDRSLGYVEAVRVYSAAIHVLQCELKEPGQPNKDSLIEKITHAKLQLQTLVRMVCPFIQDCLPKLLADGFKLAETSENECKNLSARICRTHLIDIEHNLKSFMETAHTQIQLCELSITQYDREAADQSNSILNFLTVITFLVMPVQIVTGWYGMNFIHMPELKWDYGYHYCVALGLALFALVCAMLLCTKYLFSR